MKNETGKTCEQCSLREAELEDPIFDAANAVDGATAPQICEPCAKFNIETEMMRLGTVIQ